MSIKKGDLVRIHYTGRLPEGAVFDTTDEEAARRAGIWSSAVQYGSKLAVFGNKAMLLGIEESVSTLKAGQSGTFKIRAEKAFGPRFPNLVRVMSEPEFNKGGVRAQPGLMVMVEGIPATVKSVSSGRVILDFNHPFAGKDVEYSIQLLEVISDNAEKVRALSELFNVAVRIESDKGKPHIAIPKNSDSARVNSFKAALKSSIGDWAEITAE